jgi:hypothetical protein
MMMIPLCRRPHFASWSSFKSHKEVSNTLSKKLSDSLLLHLIDYCAQPGQCVSLGMHDDDKKDFLVAKEAASMVMDIKKKKLQL